MKKTFVLTQFGSPHPWTQQYIDHVQHLAQYGWNWKIFTPNALMSKGNVEIVPMNTQTFNDLVEKKLWVRSKLAITPDGIPNMHITDFYIFAGIIFEDYLRDTDYWGITNIDVVYGRLDHYIPDEKLKECEVFSDDVNTINGVFSLWKNNIETNTLFRHIGNWKEIIGQKPCEGCVMKNDNHSLYGSDELGMTDIVRRLVANDRLRFLYPTYYPMLSHDRLQQHVPKPQLEIKPDGSLFELFYDTRRIHWEHERPVIGKEIMYFHFGDTKVWPL